MNTAKIAISLEIDLLKKIDSFVRKKLFPNRSKAIQIALKEKVNRIEKNRLASECAKLDPKFEKQMADFGLERDLEEWPEY